MESLHINCTNCTMTAGQPNAFGGTFVFFSTHKPTLKNPKEPPSQRTKPLELWEDKARLKEHQLVTAPTKNWRFSG